METDDVARALRALTPDRFFCGARRISDVPIHPGEAALYVDVAPKVRAATATGRLLAREVLRSLGVSPAPIMRNAGGAPAFPIGVCGSISHDDEFAVCVVGAGVDSNVGVDVEAAVALPAEIVGDVCRNDEERAFAAEDELGATMLLLQKRRSIRRVFLSSRSSTNSPTSLSHRAPAIRAAARPAA